MRRQIPQEASEIRAGRAPGESLYENLSLSILERIAKALDCSVERLVSTRENLKVVPAQTKRLDQALALLKEFRQRIEG